MLELTSHLNLLESRLILLGTHCEGTISAVPCLSLLLMCDKIRSMHIVLYFFSYLRPLTLGYQ